MKFINLTPHTVEFQLPDGKRLQFFNSGRDARVDSSPSISGSLEADGVIFPTTSAPILTDVYTDWSDKSKPSAREGFPMKEEGVIYIVSTMVLQHSSMVGRTDVVAPATGPKDGAIRYSEMNADGTPNARKGQIEAVTKWVTAPQE